jgi:hypothetical protein
LYYRLLARRLWGGDKLFYYNFLGWFSNQLLRLSNISISALVAEAYINKLNAGLFHVKNDSISANLNSKRRTGTGKFFRPKL